MQPVHQRLHRHILQCTESHSPTHTLIPHMYIHREYHLYTCLANRQSRLTPSGTPSRAHTASNIKRMRSTSLYGSLSSLHTLSSMRTENSGGVSTFSLSLRSRLRFMSIAIASYVASWLHVHSRMRTRLRGRVDLLQCALIGKQ